LVTNYRYTNANPQAEGPVLADDSSRLKLERAAKHIHELIAALKAFKNSEPYRVRVQPKPDLPHLLEYRLVVVRDIPPEVPLIIGDVLQNLRSAVDHLAGQLVRAANNTPDRDTAFPVYETAEKFQSGCKRQIHLMRQDAQDAIKFVQPYKGGNGDTLWRLHRLNNIDKHNLIFTTFASVTQINLFHHLARVMPALQPFADAGFIVRPDNTEPLKNGSVLFTSIGPQPDENLKFSIDVAFGEPGICEGEPVAKVIDEIAKFVCGVLVNFAPLLR
jgi:hypothetical protein